LFNADRLDADNKLFFSRRSTFLAWVQADKRIAQVISDWHLQDDGRRIDGFLKDSVLPRIKENIIGFMLSNGWIFW
jgi:hypothetical protein